MIFEILGVALMLVVTAAVTSLLSALVLMISAKMFKLKDTSYLTALKAALIVEIAGFALFAAAGLTNSALIIILGMILKFFLVTVLLAVFMVKLFYGLKKFDKTLLVWLVWVVLKTIVLFIANFLIGTLFIAIGVGAAMGMDAMMGGV